MRLQDIPEDIEPRVGDILEIEQGDVCFEVRIIGITADGYLCEQDNVQGAILLEGVALDHDDVTDITGYITEERVRLDPKCWKGKKIGNPKTKMKGGVRVNNCVPEGQQEVAESTEQSLQKKIQAKRDALGLAREQRRARGQHQQGQREIKLQAEIDKLSSQLTQMKKQDVAEAGPFSYGYKKPRKGSVAYWAEKKRKEQEKGKPPIEPKDQMVGVAKVTKAVAEGSDNNVYFEVDSEKAYNHIMKKFRSVINWDGDTMVAPQKYWGAIQELAYSAGGEAIEVGNEQGVAEGVGGWSGPLYDPALQGTGKKQRYEMMFKNGQVKRFSAMNDNEARKIAAGHGAKSVIKMKGNVPGDKIAEQGVAEGSEQIYKVVALTKSNALAKPTKMKVKADSIEDLFSRLAANDWYPLEINGVEVIAGKRLKQGVAEGYTGRETKDGTWRVFKDGQAVAVAGPFNSRDEAHAWIKKHKQGVSEAKSLKKRVRVVQGEHAGKTGWIREIKHGIHSTAPKRYYVDIDGGGQANNLPASALRLLKDQPDSQKGMAEGGHDDQFSLSGRMPATDRIPQDSTQHQDQQLAMGDKIKQQTIAYILNLRPEFERSDLELATTPELIQMLRDIQSGKMTEAEYQGRKVPLGKPMAGDVKKSKVYVRKPNGKVVKVNFGDKNMKIKKSNPKRRKSFRARHNCENPGPRWKARYWSCRAW